MLGELRETDMASGAWLNKFKEMRHRYEHHIDEEEEEMFLAVQEEFSKALANKLGAKFDRRKPLKLEFANANDNGSDKE